MCCCGWDQEDGEALVSGLLNRLLKSDKYGERRGAAFGLAGVVKGFGISCLKKYGIVVSLREGLEDRLDNQLHIIMVLVLSLYSSTIVVVILPMHHKNPVESVFGQQNVLPFLLAFTKDFNHQFLFISSLQRCF